MTTRKKKQEITEDEKYWLEYGVDIKNRKVYIDEEIEDFSTGFVIRGLMAMIEKDNEKPIDIYVNSYGGSVYDGLALCDEIESLDVEVRTHVKGKIMSMALIIFICGDKRIASKRSSFMAHSLSHGTEGKLYETEVDVKEAKRLENELLEILGERSLKDKKYWTRKIRYEDFYFDKDTAIELGMVDE